MNNAIDSALVTVSFGCGLSDRMVKAIAAEGKARGRGPALYTMIDNVGPNRYVPGSRQARATVIVNVPGEGIVWKHIRVENFGREEWHAAGAWEG